MLSNSNTYFSNNPIQQMEWAEQVVARFSTSQKTELLQDLFEAYFYHQLNPKVQDFVYLQIQINNPLSHAYYDFEHTVKLLELQQGAELKEKLVVLEQKDRKVIAIKRIAQAAAILLIFLSIPVFYQLDNDQLVSLDNPVQNSSDLMTKKSEKTASTNSTAQKPIVKEQTEDEFKEEILINHSATKKRPVKQKYTDQEPKIMDVGPHVAAIITNNNFSNNIVLSTKNDLSKEEIIIAETAVEKPNFSFVSSGNVISSEPSYSPLVEIIDHTIPFLSVISGEVSEKTKLSEKRVQPIIHKQPKMVVHGLLTDQESGEILPGAIVTIGKRQVETDNNGYYKIEVEPQKQLRFSMVGYEPEMEKMQLGSGIHVLNVMLAANSASLNTIIEISNKYKSPLSHTIVSTEVVKRQQTNSNHFSNLEEAVSQASGISVLDGQISIREGSGFSLGGGSRVMLLIDGVPTNQMDIDVSNWDFIPVENMEQVDIMKGATSTLFGSSALNGSINVRTTKPGINPVTRISTFGTFYLPPSDKEKKWWGSENHEIEPFKAGYLFSHANKIGKLDMLIGSALMYDRSFRKGDYNRYLRLNSRFGYELSKKIKLGLNINSQGGYKSKTVMWKDAGKGAYQNRDNNEIKDTVARIMIDPTIEIKDRFDNSHQIITRYYYNSSRQSSKYSGFSYNAFNFYGEYQFKRDFKELGLTLTAGSNGSYLKSLQPANRDSIYRASSFGGYLQMGKRFLKDRLNFTMGVRFEKNKIEGPGGGVEEEARPVLRSGLNFKLAKNTFVRASWGQGYRFPTISERYVNTTLAGIVVYPNSRLQSEHGWSSELGIKQGFHIGRWNGFIDFAGFWQEYDNMIELVFGQFGTSSDPELGLGFRPKNIGHTSVRVNGMELNVTSRGKLWGLPLELSGGYTYSNPTYAKFNQDSVRSSSKENILKYRRKHNLKFDIATTLKRFSFGVSGNYFSYMEAIDNIFEDYIAWGIKDYRAKNVHGQFTMGGRFAYHPHDRFKISLIGKNILNSEYTLRPGLLEAPANVSLRLTFTFK